MSQGCALLILRSKGQGHGAWLFENGFRTITDSVINLWSWNFMHLLPMSQGCALLILGSKGQRSRSWRMVIWKWSTEIMVADLNLLGSVGDLYCFSNTFSMLLYVAPICCPSCFHYISDNGHFLNIFRINDMKSGSTQQIRTWYKKYKAKTMLLKDGSVLMSVKETF